MKRIIKTNFSAVDTWQENKGYTNKGVSMTVKGLSEPMATIIQRFQRGQTVLGSKIYYDSDVNSEFENDPIFKASEFDLSDLDKSRETIEKGQKRLKELKESVANEERLKNEKAIEDRIRAEFAQKEAEKKEVVPGKTMEQNSKS